MQGQWWVDIGTGCRVSGNQGLGISPQPSEGEVQEPLESLGRSVGLSEGPGLTTVILR